MNNFRRLGLDVPYPVIVAAVWSLCLILLAGGLWISGFALGKLTIVIVPLAIAALLSALLMPLNNMLNRRAHIPRVLTSLICLFALLGFVVLGFFFVIDQVTTNYETLASKGQEGYATLMDWVHKNPSVPKSDHPVNLVEEGSKWLTQHKDSVLNNVVNAGHTTVDIVAGILICLIATFFFLLDGNKIASFIQGFVPRRARPEAEKAFIASWVTLKAYTRMQVVVAAINAAGIGLGAWIMGTPLVIPITAIVFLCSFVPIVGALASGAFAVLLALVDGGITHAVIMVIIVIGVHFLETHGLQPFLMGHAVQVHPLGVIVVVAAGTYLFGLPGALFAVPITAMLNSAIKALKADGGSNDVDNEQDLEHEVEEEITPGNSAPTRS